MRSVQDLLLEALTAHQAQVSRLRAEEAAVIARCDLLEELIAAEKRRQRETAGAAPDAPPDSKKRPREKRSLSPRLSDGEERVPIRPPTTSASRPELQKDQVPGPVPVQPRPRDEVVIVDGPDDDRNSAADAQCTPSDVLDECEALFGGPSHSCVNAGPLGRDVDGGACAVKVNLGIAVSASKVSTTKAALRGAALRKERHPRALVVQRRGDPSYAFKHTEEEGGEEGNAVEATAATPPPPQTPDAFWDVRM